MKRSTQLQNHETYTECTKCGFIYDAHLSRKDCPRCGFTMYRVISKLIYPVAILLMFLFIGISNASASNAKNHHKPGIHRSHSIATKVAQTKYKVRQHRNNIAQRKLMYDGCRPYRMGDWKACINYADRPHSRWPFNFLQ